MPGVMLGRCQRCLAQLRGCRMQSRPSTLLQGWQRSRVVGLGVLLLWQRSHGDAIVVRSESWGVCSPAWLSSASPHSKGRKKKVPPDGVKLVDEVSACRGDRISWGAPGSNAESAHSHVAVPAQADATALAQQVGHKAARAVPGEGQGRR